MTPRDQESADKPDDDGTDGLVGDAVAPRLGSTLHRVADSVTPAVPADGPARVATGARRRRRCRHVRTGLAAAMTVIVLVAGLAVLGSRRDDGAPVVAGPSPSGPDPDATEWNGLPFLAPEGIEWWVQNWSPTVEAADGSPVAMSTVGFDYEGWRWEIHAWADRPLTGLGIETRTEIVGSREVLLADSPAVDGTVGIDGIFWSDPSGARIWLSKSPSGGEFDGSYFPSDDLVRDVVTRIQSVDLATWRAALTPGPGADPGWGEATERPLRLSPPLGDDPTARPRLDLAPWSNFALVHDLPGGDGSVDLRVSSGAPSEAAWGDDPTADVAVRETTATLARGMVVPGRSVGGMQNDSLSSGVAVSWSEGGSNVAAYFPADVTDDDAVAFANSLVVLDDAQWEALLFPLAEAPGVDPTTTSTSLLDTGNDDGYPASTVPLLAPSNADWTLRSVTRVSPENVIDGSGTTYAITYIDQSVAPESWIVDVTVGSVTVIAGGVPIAGIDGPAIATIWSRGSEVLVRPTGSGVWVGEITWDDGTPVRVAVRAPGEPVPPDDRAVEAMQRALDGLDELGSEDWRGQLGGDWMSEPLLAVGDATNLADHQDPRLLGAGLYRGISVQYLSVGPGPTDGHQLFLLAALPHSSVIPHVVVPGAGNVAIRGARAKRISLEDVPILSTSSASSELTAQMIEPLGRDLDPRSGLMWEEGGTTFVLAWSDMGLETGQGPAAAVALADTFDVIDRAGWYEILGL